MELPTRLRVFVDANVLIRGVTFPRFPYEILRLAAQHKIILVISPSVLADARHYLTGLFPAHLSKLDALLAIAAVEITADPTAEEVSAHRHLARDIKDAPVVLAAARAHVDFLVSTDADLTDMDESTQALRTMIAPGKVLKVGVFLNQVMGWSHRDLEAISRRQWPEIQSRVWS
jgi:putative PIN family toxin of toxin-antitoxin system